MSEPTAYDPGRPPWTSDPEALWAAVTDVIGPFEVYSTIRSDEGEIADFRVEYLNDEACSLSGLSREQELGRPLKERFPNLHRGIFQAQVKVVETGESAHLKNLVFRSDGERSHIELAVDIHLAKLGDGLAVRLERVTQEVEEAEASERTASTLGSIFDHAAQSVYLIDDNNKFVFANTAMARSLHETPAGLIGHSINEFFPVEDAARWAETNRAVLELDHAISESEVMPLPDGDRTFLDTRFPVQDALGRPLGVAGIATDVSAVIDLETETGNKAEMMDFTSEAILLRDSSGLVSY